VALEAELRQVAEAVSRRETTLSVSSIASGSTIGTSWLRTSPTTWVIPWRPSARLSHLTGISGINMRVPATPQFKEICEKVL
jgi:hypothetical protein